MDLIKMKKYKSKNFNKKVNRKKKKTKIKFEDDQIKHVIWKRATAVVKLGTHVTKKTNMVIKIYMKIIYLINH